MAQTELYGAICSGYKYLAQYWRILQYMDLILLKLGERIYNCNVTVITRCVGSQKAEAKSIYMNT